MTDCKHLFCVTLLSIGYLSVSNLVHAREDLIPGSRYTSGRGAALGDAFLPLGDDAAAGLFYNPAVLGKLRKTELEALNFSVYGNSNFFSSAGTNSYNVTNLGSYAS